MTQAERLHQLQLRNWAHPRLKGFRRRTEPLTLEEQQTAAVKMIDRLQRHDEEAALIGRQWREAAAEAKRLLGRR